MKMDNQELLMTNLLIARNGQEMEHANWTEISILGRKTLLHYLNEQLSWSWSMTDHSLRTISKLKQGP